MSSTDTDKNLHNNNHLTYHYKPGGPLAGFIDVFWYWQEIDLLKGKECILPTGSVELVIDLDSGSTTDSIISGVRSKPALISIPGVKNKVNRLLGIHFKPGGLFPFIPVPVHQISNINVSMDDLWGKQEVERLLSTIQNTGSISIMFEILGKWLTSNLYSPLKHRPEIDFSIHKLLQNPKISIANLSESINLSKRYFIQTFQKTTGITPKLFSRIHRFQRALDIIEFQTDIDWFEVTTRCGYYDQSHFVHEFREFSGINPSTYLDIRTEHRNHIPAVN